MNDDDLFDLLGDDFDPKPKNEPVKESPKIQKLAGGEFEKFAKNILHSLIADNIPPTPTNYEIYFKTMIGEKSATFKKRINELMEFESGDESIKRASIELEIKKSYEAVSLIFQYSAGIYKQLEHIKELFRRRSHDLELAQGNLAVKNVIDALDVDIAKSMILFDKYQDEIKQNYENMRAIYKYIEEQSDFDSKYGVHNRRYFDASLERVIESNKKYGYFTTLVFFHIKEMPCSLKEKDNILKNICKIINKRLNHGDFLTHLEDDLFVLTMQHTNMEKAKKFCDRLIENVYDTNFFIGDMELAVNMEMVLASVNQDTKPKELLAHCISQLENTGRDKEPYIVIDA